MSDKVKEKGSFSDPVREYLETSFRFGFQGGMIAGTQDKDIAALFASYGGKLLHNKEEEDEFKRESQNSGYGRRNLDDLDPID